MSAIKSLLLVTLLVACAALVQAWRSAEAAAPVRLADPAPDARPTLPDLPFKDLAGNASDLRAYAGRVVVLNLWAVWCAPCREEMPSLGRLRGLVDPAEVAVLALSIDRGDNAKVEKFLAELGDHNLQVVRDASAAAARTLKLPGLPATLLIDRQGREAGRILGIAVWDGPEALETIRQLAAEPAS